MFKDVGDLDGPAVIAEGGGIGGGKNAGGDPDEQPVEIAGRDGGRPLDDADRLERQATIDRMLQDDDAAWRERRRRQKLGRYADATTREEIREVEETERAEIAGENARKAKSAAAAGVVLEMLAPSDEAAAGADDASGESSFNSAVSIKSRKKGSWFDEVDKDIDKEMSEIGGVGNIGGEGDEDGGPTLVDGKIVSRDRLQGIRVGSAGGWELEVFPGDFVVHRKYGIGRFEKTVLTSKKKLTAEEKQLQRDRREQIIREAVAERGGKGMPTEELQLLMNTFGTEVDRDPLSNPQSTLLEIAYGDATVHVPVERAYRLSRYRAGDAAVKPRLSRVKGEAWLKAKNRVEASTLQMAQDVLALYATRETLNRPPFDPALESELNKFSTTFPYEPTPDQSTCFEHVENDMVWRGRPMDRLICGDVGFGKTEVAIRALYRCVANGRQAALLAPTGVLAAQHFKNIAARMGEDSEYGVRIAMLRGGMGKNTKKGRELRERIAAGEVDLIVGTHALLSNGLSFQDLGLLVVDEEQRFGVKQKERLKLICSGVDVLTLSATPIPRTLQMSLSGIRDTSTLRSPPPMRKPTKTFVLEYSDDAVVEAIEREMARHGQCYYVLPRIAMLAEAEKKLKELFPGLRMIQAHGRMGRGAEEAVAAFAEGKYDVLLATTVIENGVDIPAVNTIIIQNAQALGMSTLYQLRGRVGRSSLQAYAYFLHKPEAITEQSAMRLQAMADLHELGSGFDVANRDLEIRGAGSLLGTEQSGMAAKVGFDLYMRMLKKSIRQLRGLDLPAVPRTNVLLPGGEGSIEAGDGGTDDGDGDGAGDQQSHAFKIPAAYIEDGAERSKQESAARLAESSAQLVELTNAWKDEHGPLPPSLQRRLKTLHLHACSRILGIDLVGMRRDPDGGEEGAADCVLRSPGLRPRHWAHICKSLPRGVPTKGLDALFPARLVGSENDVEVVGGDKLDLKELLEGGGGNGAASATDEEEEWDALDQEEVEAMKEISSALKVRSMDEVDVEQYPRFAVRNFHKIKQGARVDALLKVLLPAAKVVYQKQVDDKEKARVATELREKRELMKRQQKEAQAMEAKRLGYRY